MRGGGGLGAGDRQGVAAPASPVLQIGRGPRAAERRRTGRLCSARGQALLISDPFLSRSRLDSALTRPSVGYLWMEEVEVSGVTPEAVEGGLDGARAEVSELDEREPAVAREDLGEEVIELNSDEDELAEVQEAEDVEVSISERLSDDLCLAMTDLAWHA
jgi:hypothetical protein